jgi:hypothetical protein
VQRAWKTSLCHLGGGILNACGGGADALCGAALCTCAVVIFSSGASAFLARLVRSLSSNNRTGSREGSTRAALYALQSRDNLLIFDPERMEF